MPIANTELPQARALRRVSVLAALGSALVLLVACSSPTVSMFDEPSPSPTPTASAPAPAPNGNVFGTGPVKVGMLLPLTQAGQPSVIGQSLRNAAQLASEEAAEKGFTDVTLTIQDDRSTAEAAGQAAQTQLAAGAMLLLGPLYSGNVRPVAGVAHTAARPVIAFSSDASVASSGVYLLSFLVETYVDRVMEFAVSKGKKSFAVIAPQNDFGNVAVNEAQLQASRLNVPLVVIARYPPGQPAAGAQQIAEAPQPVDALLVVEQADGAAAVAAALTAKGFKGQILGTGLWNDPKALAVPGLAGAWIAGPENANFDKFVAKYRAKFSAEPTRLATLAYDAVSLVEALAHTQGSQPFSAAVLTNGAGFNGADGVFRFLPDGRNQRGLAVMQIGAGTTTVVSPAPGNFAGG